MPESHSLHWFRVKLFGILQKYENTVAINIMILITGNALKKNVIVMRCFVT